MTWGRKLPGETDPLLVQSMRTDFPASVEHQVVDGGVAEGRREPGDVGGLIWAFVLIFALLIVAAVIVNWHAFFP